MIRILLADPHPLTHAGLQAILQAVRDLELLPEVAYLQDCPQLCHTHNANVLLVNTHHPDLQVELLLTEMAAIAPQTHVLLMLVPGQAAPLDLHKLLQAGRGSAILSDDPIDLLINALRTVGQGNPWFSPRLLAQLLKNNSQPEPPSTDLTDRELDVLHHLAQGLSNKEIARQLHISPRTVGFHVGNIFQKLQVASRVEAILWFQRQPFSTEQK